MLIRYCLIDSKLIVFDTDTVTLKKLMNTISPLFPFKMKLEIIEVKAESGVDKKTPLLFVHGSFCSAPIWRYRFMPFFAEHGHDCYAVSLRGHGKSGGDWPLHFYGLVDFVEDAWQVIQTELGPAGGRSYTP